MKNRKKLGADRPTETEARDGLKAAGFPRGLSSVTTSRLINEVFGQNTKTRASTAGWKKPEVRAASMHETNELLSQVVSRLDKLISLWS